VVLLLFANFSYNRGSLLAPVLAVAAAYSAHVRRLSVPLLALAATPVLLAALTFGWYRSTDLEIQDLLSANASVPSPEMNVVGFLQVYGPGPQFLAYLIDQSGDGFRPYYGRTLVSSLLYPVPVLGKPFRETSGVSIYNRLIYGEPDNLDQVIPYDAELYLNFHTPGVVAGFALLGWLVSWFQGRFLRAGNPVETYCWFLLSLWVVFPGSVPVTSQMYVYFFWPIYGYFLLRKVGQRRRRAPAPGHADQTDRPPGGGRLLMGHTVG
jgi:hypothetical protein